MQVGMRRSHLLKHRSSCELLFGGNLPGLFSIASQRAQPNLFLTGFLFVVYAQTSKKNQIHQRGFATVVHNKMWNTWKFHVTPAGCRVGGGNHATAVEWLPVPPSNQPSNPPPPPANGNLQRTSVSCLHNSEETRKTEELFMFPLLSFVWATLLSTSPSQCDPFQTLSLLSILLFRAISTTKRYF